MPRFDDATVSSGPDTGSDRSVNGLTGRGTANRRRSGQVAVETTQDVSGLRPEVVTEVHRVILGWYRRQGRDLPWRHTRDPYAILVAETMLQQTQVDRVRPKWHAFLALFPTLAGLAAAPRAEVIRAWAGLGYNRRAVGLHEIARTVTERGDATLPSTIDGLRALKGIGPYTAGAIACFAFGLPEPILDTNVRRVLGRIFQVSIPSGVNADRHAWATARDVLPVAADVYDWNQALMDLGATICVARAPRCAQCPVATQCVAFMSQPPVPMLPGFGDDRVPPSIPEAVKAPVALVAETREAYRPAPVRRSPERFEGSRRWFRGRAVAALRALPTGASLAVDALGPLVDPAYEASSRRAWLLDLLGNLTRDGLVVVEGDGEASVARLA